MISALKMLYVVGTFLFSGIFYNSSALKLGVLYSQAANDALTLKHVMDIAVEDIKSDTLSDITLVLASYNSSSSRDVIEKTCDLINQNIPVIISASNSPNTKLQIDTAQQLHIPLISVSATNPFLNTEATPFLFTLSPSDFYQSEVIYDILVRYEWYEVTLMSSTDSYGINGLLRLYDLLGKNDRFHINEIVYIQSSYANYGIQELEKLKFSLSRVIILNCPASSSVEILSKAEKFGMLTEGFVWIVTDSLTSYPTALADSNGIYSPSLEGLIGITGALNKSKEYSDFKVKYLTRYPNRTAVDLGIYEMLFYDALQLATYVLKDFSVDYHKTDVTCTNKSPWNKGKEIMEKVLSSKYNGITAPINFTKNGESTRIMYDVLNFKNDVFQKIGEWNNYTHLDLQNTITFLGGTKSIPFGAPETLSGYHFKLGLLEEEPFVLKSRGCNRTNCYSGYCIDLINRLSKDLNFTFEFLEPLDQKAGSKDASTGQWNGMVADLINRRIDMIAIHLSASSLRKEVIDFSAAFMDAGIVAVVQGETGAKNLFFFLSPLSTEVWIFVIVCNILVTAIICFLGKTSPYGKYGSKVLAMQTCQCKNCKNVIEKRNFEGKDFRNVITHDCLVDKNEDENKMDDLSFFNSAWLVTVGLVGQAAEALPYCASARSLLFTWWLFILIIVSMYTANLTAFLTLSNLGVTLNSVKDLLKQDKYSWGMIGSRYTESLLLNNLDDDYVKIANEGEKLNNLTHALNRIREGGFVFIDESPVLAHNLKDDCQVFSIGSEFQKFVYSFGLPKNAPYANLINRRMLKYREEGYMDILWAKWSAGTKACSSSVGSDKKLTLHGLSGVFFILLFGIAIAFLIFIVEWMFCAWSMKKHNGFSIFSSLRKLFFLKLNNILVEWLGIVSRKNVTDSTNNGTGSPSKVIKNETSSDL